MTNLFLPGKPQATSPCVKHTCTLCCRDTNMPLTLADMERLTSRGERLEAFSQPDEEDQGYIRLVNTEKGECYFLAPDGRCRVQADKPEGCRLYPFIYDMDKDAVLRDSFCPFNREFEPPEGTERKVRDLVSRLEAEAAARVATGR